jgi:hypothetical protein
LIYQKNIGKNLGLNNKRRKILNVKFMGNIFETTNFLFIL